MNTKPDPQSEIAMLKLALLQAREVQTINRDIYAAQDTPQLLQALAQPAFDAGAAIASLSYVAVDTDNTPLYLEIVASVGMQAAQVAPVGMRMRWQRHAVAQRLESHPDRPLYIADAQHAPDLDKAIRIHLANFGTGAEVAIPLRQAEQWVGLVTFDWTTAHDFSDYERTVYAELPALATVAVQNRQLVERLEQSVVVRTTELQESQFLFQTFLDNFPDLAYATNRQGQLILCNRALAATFETTAEALLGHTLENVAPAVYVADLQAITQQVMATQFPQGLEITVKVAGDERNKFIIAFPLYDAEERMYGVGNVAADITKRKAAEAERATLQRKVIMAQREALKELATPIIPIFQHPDGRGSVVVMPLVGHIDTLRAKDIMRALLSGIQQHRAKVVLLDMTGVPLVDTAIVNHLNHTIQAARLKGARTIVTGLSDAVAETLIDLGIDWTHVTTLRDLQTGLLVALNILGYTLKRK